MTDRSRWEYAVRPDGSLALYRNGATAGFFGRQFGFLRMEHPPAANGVRKGVVVTLLPPRDRGGRTEMDPALAVTGDGIWL